MRHDLIETVDGFLSSSGCENCSIVVAVSGGIDSVVLLAAVHDLYQRRRLSINVVHVNHGLRETEADIDEEFVRNVANSIGCTFYSAKVDVLSHANETGKGIEASARELRYGVLLDVAQKTSSPFVLTGHNADDVAETLLMNLARGSGIDGLTSLQAVRAIDVGIVLLRPLLTTPRSAISEFAHTHELKWREDLSNAELHFIRNRVRHEIMPHMKNVFGADVGTRIATSAQLLNDVRAIVKEATYRRIEESRNRGIEDEDLRGEEDERKGGIDLKMLANESPAMKAVLIRHMLFQLTQHPPSMNDTQRVLGLLDAEVGSMATLGGGVIAYREREFIECSTKIQETFDDLIAIKSDGVYVAGSTKIEIRTQHASDAIIDHHPSSATIDASAVVGDLVWRRWVNRDRMIPFGSEHSVLVSDLLTNAKISHSKRKDCRVLSDDQGILWLCGIRPAERTRVTSSTQTVKTILQTTDTLQS